MRHPRDNACGSFSPFFRRVRIACLLAVASGLALTVGAAQARQRHNGQAQAANGGGISFPAGVPVQPGTIIIRTRERALYYVMDSGQAIRYPIAVPRNGKEWSGSAKVNGKFVKPDWSPPAVVRRDNPSLPSVIPGGAPNNPMGVAALTLDRDEIAIHGTSGKMRRSIGSAASYGCIRMYNEDVVDLYSRVSVGTPVLLIQ